jgi:DNA transformation protein and related proteins
VSVSADYLTYVVDQLAPFAKVVARRMFGGIGLYSDGLFFGLIDDDTLYFKVDDSNRSDYIERGCAAFQPLPDVASMSYFSVPEDVLEDAEQLAVWSRKSLRVAAAAAAAARFSRSNRSRPRSTRRAR